MEISSSNCLGSIENRIERSFRVYRDVIPDFNEVIKPLDARIAKLSSLTGDCRVLESCLKNTELYGDQFEEKYDVKVNFACPKILGSIPSASKALESRGNEGSGVNAENNENEKDEAEKENKRILSEITQKEFNSIPKYMLGRFTLESLNEIVDKVDEFLTMKNQILTKPKRLLTKLEREKLDSWKSLEENSKKQISSLFCVENDIRPLLQEKLRPLFAKSVPCLRHIRRIREERCGKFTFYFP